jgi:hypothetical protein
MGERTAKQKLEQAVNRAGKSLSAVVDLFEVHGGEFDEEQIKKVFTFLGNAAVAAHQKALLVRQMSGNAFSLDKENPTTIASQIDITTTSVGQAPMPTNAPTARRKAIGRLIDSREPVFALEEAQPQQKKKNADWDEGGVGFIDE